MASVAAVPAQTTAQPIAQLKSPLAPKPLVLSRDRRSAPASSIHSSVAGLLDSMHPSVLALLVAYDDSWELFERSDGARPGSGILCTVSFTELMRILSKSAANALARCLAEQPPILQAPGNLRDHPALHQDRITVSPWRGFDLALMLRDGNPRFALCLAPDTSVYVAEEALPRVARHFDHLEFTAERGRDR